MKIRLLASAAVAVMAVAVAAPAFAETGGYIDAGYVSVRSTPTTVEGFSFGAGFNTNPKAGEWGFKGDMQYTESNDTGTNVTTGSLLVSKTTGFGLYGFYGSLSRLGGKGTSEVGVLVQTNQDRFIGRLAVAYGEINSPPFRPNFWSGTIDANFYPTDNLSLGASVSLTDQDGAGGTLSTVGLNAEWRPDSTKASFFASATNYDPAGAGADIPFYRAGVRWNFGSANLKARDAAGGIPTFGIRPVF